MGDPVSSVLAGEFHLVLHDQGPAQCRDQRVFLFVERVGLDDGSEEVVRELLAQVELLVCDSTCAECLLAVALEGALLADVR